MQISEFLPNPVGKDTVGEFIEVWNDGQSAVNLSGFVIKDKSGKLFRLSGELDPGDFKAIFYRESKLTLNNSDEALFLYDTAGRLVDTAEFAGSAIEGMSFARVGGVFAASAKPTPGEANIQVAAADEGIAFAKAGEEITRDPGLLSVIAAGLLASFALASLFLYLININGFHHEKKNAPAANRFA